MDLAFLSMTAEGVGGAATSYPELELKLGWSMVGRAMAWAWRLTSRRRGKKGRGDRSREDRVRSRT